MFGNHIRRWARTEQIEGRLDALARQAEDLKLLIGRGLSHQVRGLPDGASLQQAEFKVFSQFGDDGIIQFLLSALPVCNDTFIEFGVEDYQESNTRFLMENDNWRGLVMDSSQDNVDRIRNRWYGTHDLTALQAWVTAENINNLLEDGGFKGPIGLLHIDIDGNDLHVWEAIEAVQPDILILEYNAILGSEHRLTIPYDPDFDRRSAHWSWLYFGASLRALAESCDRKGYAFVGCNSAGNNAYFVRRPLIGRVRETSVEDGFVMSRFRESRDKAGAHSFLSGPDRLAAIRDCAFLDLERNEVRTVAEIYGL